MTPALDKLIKENYNTLLEKCKKKLKTWSVLPLSLIGKINVIKMNILQAWGGNRDFWGGNRESIAGFPLGRAA